MGREVIVGIDIPYDDGKFAWDLPGWTDDDNEEWDYECSTENGGKTFIVRCTMRNSSKTPYIVSVHKADVDSRKSFPYRFKVCIGENWDRWVATVKNLSDLAYAPQAKHALDAAEDYFTERVKEKTLIKRATNNAELEARLKELTK